MRKRHLLFIFLTFLSCYCFSQSESDGFYFEISEDSCLYNRINLIFSEESVCIPGRPVIPLRDIVWISDQKVDSLRKIKSLVIKLSQEGSRKLKALSKVYQGENIAFVLEGEAICRLKVNDIISNGRIILTEELEHSTLQYVHGKVEGSLK